VALAAFTAVVLNRAFPQTTLKPQSMPSFRSSKHCCPTVSELHKRAALMPPEPAESDGPLDPGAELIGRASYVEERPVDQLDEDTCESFKHVKSPAPGPRARP
jgi:hypothetical protein